MNHTRQETSMMFFMGACAIICIMNNTGGTMVPKRERMPSGSAMDFMVELQWKFQARAGFGPRTLERTMYKTPLPIQTGSVA